MLLLVSITLILLGLVIEIFLDYHTSLILLGGIGLIMGHLLNYKNHKKKHL